MYDEELDYEDGIRIDAIDRCREAIHAMIRSCKATQEVIEKQDPITGRSYPSWYIEGELSRRLAELLEDAAFDTRKTIVD